MTSDLALFPISAAIDAQGQLRIAGHSLSELADQTGTPFYLYDGQTIRSQVERLHSLLRAHYPGEGLIAYASKAYFSYSIGEKLAALGVGADVVSLGEIHLAREVGFPAGVVHLHGNNKTEAELRAALEWGIQAIVVDSLDELEFLEEIARETGRIARIWLRITPDLNVNTHPHIETSHSGSKFGLHVDNGDAAAGIRLAVSSPWIDLAGLHCHLGSQIFEPGPYAQAIERLYALADSEGYVPEEISPGGGWGVRYTEKDPSDDAAPWIESVSRAVRAACEARGWQLPRLVLEPGRWLVARAGVAVYRVGAQKRNPGGLHIVAVDGGLADNPRVALYQAEYTALAANRASEAPVEEMRVVGKFCESGDVLIPSIRLPELRRGDVLAIPTAGAYQLAMSSNYNFAARPTVLWLEEGQVEMMQCCEQPDQPGWWVYHPGR